MEVSLRNKEGYKEIIVVIDDISHTLQLPNDLNEHEQRAYIDKFMDELQDTFIDAGDLYDSN